LSRIVRSARALRDAEEIWGYITNDDPAAAIRQIERIDEKLRFLASAPPAGTRRSELGMDVRSFAVGNYLIFYRPIQDGIRLLRVLNASRDIRKAFHR
jgi:toxin ParE1/3/4